MRCMVDGPLIPVDHIFQCQRVQVILPPDFFNQVDLVRPVKIDPGDAVRHLLEKGWVYGLEVGFLEFL